MIASWWAKLCVICLRTTTFWWWQYHRTETAVLSDLRFPIPQGNALVPRDSGGVAARCSSGMAAESNSTTFRPKLFNWALSLLVGSGWILDISSFYYKLSVLLLPTFFTLSSLMHHPSPNCCYHSSVLLHTVGWYVMDVQSQMQFGPKSSHG